MKSKPCTPFLRATITGLTPGRARPLALALSCVLLTACASVGPDYREPPPVDVDLLGIFGPKSRRIAVLSDGEILLNVLEGGVVKEKFIVHKIGLESVDLTFVGFPDEAPHRLAIGG